MLALDQHESELCPLCGRHLSICTDPANERRVKVGPPTRCHFTSATSAAREPYSKVRTPGALMFSAHLT